jgi:lipopolysaccharide biosynthesis glycosyltransferase
MNILHVCTAFDQSFRIPASIMMHSVVKNSDHRIHFHLMIPKLAKDELGKFLDDIRLPPNSEYSIYQVDNKSFAKELRMNGVRHFSDAAIFRLFMTDYLPEFIDQILYLDGDLYVNLDISEIFTKYSKTAFSARIERAADGYFNSGVFLTSLNYWRSHQVKKQSVDFLLQNPTLKYKDQDSLNYIFKSINSPLEKIYNFPFADFRYFRKSTADKCIFHFTGSIKPWKIHAPRALPVSLWRKTYTENYYSEISLQRVKWFLLKKSIIWIKLLTNF